MPDKVWPFRTTAMVTIDRAMDMQHTMFELAQLTNDYYRLQLLLVILTAFMMIVFDCHGLLDLLSNRTKKFQVTRQEGSLLLCFQILVNVCYMLGLVVVCSLLKASVRRTGDLVHKTMIVTRSNTIRNRMMQFSMQIKRNMPKFTAFEMFEIDGTLLYGIVGATTTYLIILLQYSINNPDVSEVTSEFVSHQVDTNST